MRQRNYSKNSFKKEINLKKGAKKRVFQKTILKYCHKKIPTFQLGFIMIDQEFRNLKLLRQFFYFLLCIHRYHYSRKPGIVSRILQLLRDLQKFPSRVISVLPF